MPCWSRRRSSGGRRRPQAAQSGPSGRAGRPLPGLLDRVAGRRDRLRVGARRGAPRRLGRRGRRGVAGLGRRRGPLLGPDGRGGHHRRVGAGAGVDDRLDAPVGPDDIDRGLPEHLVAATADERVARAGVGEPQRERVAVDRDDLAVLREVHPRQASAQLGGVDDVGPEAAYVDQRQSAGRGRLRGRCGSRLRRRGLGGGRGRRRRLPRGGRRLGRGRRGFRRGLRCWRGGGQGGGVGPLGRPGRGRPDGRGGGAAGLGGRCGGCARGPRGVR